MGRLDVNLATAVLEAPDHTPSLVLGYGVGVNTARIFGTTSTVELPYVTPIDTGDVVLLARIDDGAYVIIGPVNQP